MGIQKRTMGLGAAALAAAVAACAAFAPLGVEARPRPARLAKPSGGLVEREAAGRRIRVIDAQGAIPHGTVGAAVRGVRLRSLLPLSAETGRIPAGADAWRVAWDAARTVNAGASVLVVDDASMPLVVASPDARWAVANVASLRDEPERAVARLERLLWNAVARALGAGSAGDGGVIAQFRDAAGLDALPDAPGPASHNALMDAARAHGIGLVRLATYRQACIEGWAPAPTNDVQKAIWERVHSEKERGPSHGLKISP